MGRYLGRTYRKRRKKVCESSTKSENICEENLNSLSKWMGRNGFKPSKKLKPKNFSDSGRGLMAKENIFSGDIVISIPEKLLITPRKILKLDLGTFFKKFYPSATGHEILSVFLMCEQTKSVTSEWKHYIKTLPQSYDIPAFYDFNVLPELPASISSLVSRQIETVKQSYGQLSELLKNLELSSPVFHNAFGFDIYKWAWCCVNTRCVYFDCFQDNCCGKSCTFHLALAPYLDLLNHNPEVQVEVGFNKKTKQYEIKSLCNFKKYSQVFINYGSHSNRTLFLEYGFVVPNNCNDTISFSLEDIVTACEECCFVPNQLQAKMKFILQKDLVQNLTCSLDGLSWNLSHILRILCFDPYVEWWNIVYLNELDMFHDTQLNYEILKKKLLSIKLNEFNISIKDNYSLEKNCSIINLVYKLLSIEKSPLIKAMK